MHILKFILTSLEKGTLDGYDSDLSPQNSDFETLTSNMTVFGDKGVN